MVAPAPSTLYAPRAAQRSPFAPHHGRASPSSDSGPAMREKWFDSAACLRSAAQPARPLGLLPRSLSSATAMTAAGPRTPRRLTTGHSALHGNRPLSRCAQQRSRRRFGLGTCPRLTRAAGASPPRPPHSRAQRKKKSPEPSILYYVHGANNDKDTDSTWYSDTMYIGHRTTKDQRRLCATGIERLPRPLQLAIGGAHPFWRRCNRDQDLNLRIAPFLLLPWLPALLLLICRRVRAWPAAISVPRALRSVAGKLLDKHAVCTASQATTLYSNRVLVNLTHRGAIVSLPVC